MFVKLSTYALLASILAITLSGGVMATEEPDEPPEGIAASVLDVSINPRGPHATIQSLNQVPGEGTFPLVSTIAQVRTSLAQIWEDLFEELNQRLADYEEEQHRKTLEQEQRAQQEQRAREQTRVQAPPPAPASPIAPNAHLERIRYCESKNDYSAINPTGTYRGAYQFSRTTWNWVAERYHPELVGVDPAAASPAHQDAMAMSLYTMPGGGPTHWPVCSKH